MSVTMIYDSALSTVSRARTNLSTNGGRIATASAAAYIFYASGARTGATALAYVGVGAVVGVLEADLEPHVARFAQYNVGLPSGPVYDAASLGVVRGVSWTLVAAAAVAAGWFPESASFPLAFAAGAASGAAQSYVG